MKIARIESSLINVPFTFPFDRAPNPVRVTLALPTTPGLGYTPKAGILDLAVD